MSKQFGLTKRDTFLKKAMTCLGKVSPIVLIRDSSQFIRRTVPNSCSEVSPLKTFQNPLIRLYLRNYLSKVRS